MRKNSQVRPDVGIHLAVSLLYRKLRRISYKAKKALRGTRTVRKIKKQPVMIGCDGTAIYKKEESPVPGKATGEIMKNPRKTNGFRDVGSSLVCMILI